jgi:hypothetical protein
MLMDRYIFMSKSNKTIKSKKMRIILLVGIPILLLAAGGVAFYFGYYAPSMKRVADDKTATTSAATAYAQGLKQKDDQVTKLVNAGDAASVKQADTIVASQVVAAQASGDDRHIVDAGIAKASLLIQTGRAQEAIDSVLSLLDQKYGSNDAYKYDIDGSFAYAYRELNNTAKADEYFNKIPGQSWDN